jgi:outer membrane cobalamin receptor
VAATLLLASSQLLAQDAKAGVVKFNIESQPLAQAVNTWADQAGLQVIWPAGDPVAYQSSPAVRGQLEPMDALRVLLEDTGLTYSVISDGQTVAIQGRSVSAESGEQGTAPATSFATASQLSARAEVSAAAAGPRSMGTGRGGSVDELEEVIVTGTHIRGAASISPPTILDRDYIERSGSSTVFQVIQGLPQNFSGGETEATQGLPGGSFNNISHGSSANLRGLGANSTLVLVNGHRVAPAGFGQFVDLSLIPLSSVERIEVLTDGASAIYGSDAVGGVVNIILREAYDGAETSVTGGVAAGGEPNEYRFSQTLGSSNENISALLTYEYLDRGRLDASERDYSRSAGDPFDLLPEQRTNSALATVQARVSSRVTLSGAVLFSDRDSSRNAFNTAQGLESKQSASTTQLSTQIGANIALPGAWIVDLSAGYSKGSMHETNEPSATVFDNSLDLETLEAIADGALFESAAGDVRLAVGASVRRDGFEGELEGLQKQSRRVSAAFAELSVPIFGTRNALPAFNQLELSLAGRYEDYSDFGNSTNPKFGLLWAPVASVRMHATYGTSFRAPIFFELDEAFNRSEFLFDFPDPTSATGTTLTIASTGNNADLRPEKATTWSAGIEFRPETPYGLALSATYFDTVYKDRIVEPLPGPELANVFALEAIYQSLITRDPSAGLVTSLSERPTFQNFHGDFTPDEVGAVVDARLHNLSREHVNGIDFQVASSTQTSLGLWSLSLASAYLLNYSDRVTATSPSVNLVDTAFHQAALRTRGSVSWEQGGWGVTTTINLVDGYQNNTVDPVEDIASWTTVDLQVAYDAGADFGWAKGLRIVLSAMNVLDRQPPHVNSPLSLFDVGFDPTNASPLGRFVSLAATKSW